VKSVVNAPVEASIFQATSDARRGRPEAFDKNPDFALTNRLPTIPGMLSQTVSSLLRLPRRKRLEIAGRLWLSVADEKEMPVPESHKKILDARLAAYRSGKGKPIPHEELMRRLRTS